MNDKNTKKLLTDLLKSSELKYKTDDLLLIFEKSKYRIDGVKLLEILKQLTVKVPNANKSINIFNKNIKKKAPKDNLYDFLNNISNEINNSKREEKMETPKLSSTKIPEPPIITPEGVSEIRERLVQATASSSINKSGPTMTSLLQTSPINNTIATTIKCHYALWDFNYDDNLNYTELNAAAIPITSQEIIVLNELLYCLFGVNGEYIIPEKAKCSGNLPPVNFRISDQIQFSLSDVVKEILPLASYYSQLQRFIKNVTIVNCGQVLQALGAALRSLTNDYYAFITQLESEHLKGNLNLHKLLFMVRPTMNTMEIITDTITAISNADIRGGKVLTLLHDKITSLTGDIQSQKILIHLTQIVAIPYMEILQLWITKGVICDPQQEFLIEDNEIIRREEMPELYSGDYWQKRYTIRRDRIPRFLEKMSDIILRTGKYLNVIRQCGQNVIPPTTNSLSFSHTDQNYIRYINTSYSFASKTLLNLLIKDKDLIGHLQSVKSYFLLQQSDFISQFMDTCEQELLKNIDEVQPMRIKNILELTLKLSSAKYDPYNDNLETMLLPYDLITQMSKIINNEEEYWHNSESLDLSGLECFAFNYEVQWPISLVLNQTAISKYQMLFRQLFYCKHVERQLCRVWSANKNTKKFTPQSAELYRFAFALRQRMLIAIQNIEYYMMIEVLEPNWHIFKENMNKVENVDDVLTAHQDFLDLCLKNCMLTDPLLLRSIIKLCNICLKFCEFVQKAQRYFVDAELTSMLCTSSDNETDSEYDLSTQGETECSPSDTFSERVKNFDVEFTDLLLSLLKQINDIAYLNPSDKFINLIHRINFNSFYTEKLKLLCAKDSMGETECSPSVTFSERVKKFDVDFTDLLLIAYLSPSDTFINRVKKKN